MDEKINPLLAQGRIIAFHRNYVDLTGSVTAALMLSQALYWQGICRAEDGYWWKTHAEWIDETGMKREAVDTARKACARWLTVEVRGLPARMYWKLDADALALDLEHLAKNRKPVCGNPANLNAGIKQTGLRESRKHLNETEITTEITTEKNNTLPPAQFSACDDNVCRVVETPPAADDNSPERQAGAMAKALRLEGVQATSCNPLLLAWIASGVSIAYALECVEIARASKPPPQPIPAKYLDTVIASERAKARESPGLNAAAPAARRAFERGNQGAIDEAKRLRAAKRQQSEKTI